MNQQLSLFNHGGNMKNPGGKGVPKVPKTPQIRVQVTKKEIDEAIPRDSGHCMIAEAVKKAYPAGRFVSVDLQTVRVTDPQRGQRFIYLTPRTAQAALVHWDDGVKPEPYEFTLKRGQVIRAGNPKTHKKPRSPEHREKTRNSLKKALLARAKLITRQKGSGNVPDRVGGKAPPKMTGTPRAFGLRSFVR